MGLDLKLVDEDGATLPAQRGVVGRLRVKGASVAERYFGEVRSHQGPDQVRDDIM
jgi:fatty-acyl-CoA synthase